MMHANTSAGIGVRDITILLLLLSLSLLLLLLLFYHKGLAPWVDEEFTHLSKKLTTIEAFAAWKYPVAAAHLCTLASFEE